MQSSTRSAVRLSLLAIVALSCRVGAVHGAQAPECRVVQQGKQVELHSPFFVFRLDASEGLRAVAWENRLTGKKISLGGGSEVEVDIGQAGRPHPDPLPKGEGERGLAPKGEGAGAAQMLKLLVSKLPVQSGPAESAVFELTAAQQGISARVAYCWDAKQPVLRKTVEIVNGGKHEVRVLNVRLGSYRTDAKAVSREQGFPVYLDDQFFLSLAHPAGWATAQGNEVSLRQHPGVRLAPGGKFSCMEAVYGVAEAGQARQRFVAHVRGRMRRVLRGHDKPYAIFEPFGARPDGNFDETEAFVLDNIAKVAQGQRESGCHFDLYSVDFWVDSRGDLIRCDPQRFPNGLEKIKQELKKLGTAPGLWIDSSMTHWSIGGNPAVRPTFTHDPKSPAPGVPIMCRATEPIKSMYTRAFRHHVRQNGVRLLKFDNLHSICNNPSHDHLPGIYSTEAIQNSVIEFLHAMDEECPDVFLMLYWGHRSPWWLLDADTLFDSGIGIEAASPSDFPSPYARDSITQKLDQAQWHAQDVPCLGKDSLGVWLSDWGWNSCVGKERWQEGFVMDLCRGSLLAQPWSDTAWLSPPERKQMADFIALLKARPECFGSPRFILGDPWKGEPYGYCCTDGRRAMVALNNCTWEDRSLPLKLNSAWGLPDGRTWDLLRWYPDPARLRNGAAALGDAATIWLRPFEVVLLEVVPAGEKPALNRPFDEKPIPAGFAEASRPVEVTVEEPSNEPAPAGESIWTPLKPLTLRSEGGATLSVTEDGSILASGKSPSFDTYTVAANTDLTGITAIRLEVLPDATLPGNGPGRAVNGNFMLNELCVKASPQANPAAGVPVALRNPAADFSQDSHGGWPVAAAIDGDPNTGWSIDPAEGLRHVAVFETEKPISFAGGTTLTFTLLHGEREHALGRFRLSVTTAKPPIPLPKGYGPRPLIVKGQAPPSGQGGTLVVSLQMSHAGSPYAIHNVGSHFSCQARLAEKPITVIPVLGRATYPAPWQAWRLALDPSAAPRPFELLITAKLAPNIQRTCRGHFVPR